MDRLVIASDADCRLCASWPAAFCVRRWHSRARFPNGTCWRSRSMTREACRFATSTRRVAWLSNSASSPILRPWSSACRTSSRCVSSASAPTRRRSRTCRRSARQRCANRSGHACSQSVRQELADVPVAGIVVVSDGADNSASDLSAALVGLRIRQIPVYTVGVGRERFARDVSLDRLDVPATTLKGSGVLATATIGARGVSGDSVTVTTEADGHIVATQAAAPSGRTRSRRRAGPGSAARRRDARDHRARVAVAAAKSSPRTTRRRRCCGCGPGSRRVLYLEGEPRFEFAFLRRAFDGDSAVRLVGLLRSAKGKYLRINVADSLDLIGGFPTRRDELFQYRALILGNIEASFFTGDQLRMIADFVDRRGGALIALGGREALAEGGLCRHAGGRGAAVHARDTAAARRPTPAWRRSRSSRRSAGLDASCAATRRDAGGNASRWDSLPPLTAVNHLGDLRAGADDAARSASRCRAASACPILAVQRYGRGLAAVLGVQDTWTWKMDPRSPVEDRSYETFWRQLVRWTLDQVPDRVDVAAVPDRVGPGEPVTLRARVVDSIYMDVNNADGDGRGDVADRRGDAPCRSTGRCRTTAPTPADFVADEQGTYRFSVAGGARAAIRPARRTAHCSPIRAAPTWITPSCERRCCSGSPAKPAASTTRSAISLAFPTTWCSPRAASRRTNRAISGTCRSCCCCCSSCSAPSGAIAGGGAWHDARRCLRSLVAADARRRDCAAQGGATHVLHHHRALRRTALCEDFADRGGSDLRRGARAVARRRFRPGLPRRGSVPSIRRG